MMEYIFIDQKELKTKLKPNIDENIPFSPSSQT